MMVLYQSFFLHSVCLHLCAKEGAVDSFVSVVSVIEHHGSCVAAFVSAAEISHICLGLSPFTCWSFFFIMREST